MKYEELKILLDRQEVTGSIPVRPTQISLNNFVFMYIVYVIYSLTFDKTYIGYTSDIQKRLASHNHPKNKGWTGKYMPWTLIYFEVFPSKKESLKRERQLKSYRGREYLRSLSPG